MKMKQKLEAIRLRKTGKSYKEILKRLKVSKSTLSLWLRDIRLTPKQHRRIYVTLRQVNAYRMAKKKQKDKLELTQKIIKESMCEFEKLKDDHLFIAGLMLYWAEGDKTEANEMVKFSNSDPIMIKLLMRWFREACRVPEQKFRIALHIHELHCRKNIEQYWSKITGISVAQFNKTQIKPTALKHRRNPLYDGTCSIRVCNKNLFRKIKGWKLGFQKKFNLTTPSFNG